MEQQTIKMCTGCGRLNTNGPLGLNKHGELYLACCPDNSYKEITAVEWLSIMLKDSSKELFDGNIWEQAKAMENEQRGYTKQEFLDAAKLGEVSMIDARHIVSLLDEVRELNNK